MKTLSNRQKRVIAFLFFAALVLTSASAAAADNGLNNIMKIALGFFSSNILRGVMAIALGGIAFTLLSNRGEPGLFKKFLPWIGACVIILSMSTIIEIVFGEGIGITGDASKWDTL